MDIDDLISSLRTSIDDLDGDKSVYRENISRSIQGNQVSGGAGTYQLNNKRIIATTLQLNVDAGGWKPIAASPGGYPGSEDDQRGRFVLTTPAASSLFAIYDFQYFTDDELTTFLGKACTFVDESITDPALIASSLTDALVFKAASDACFALSARRADLYTAGAGGKTAQKGDIAKKYQAMAKDLFERAVAERLAANGSRKGTSTVAASGRRKQYGNVYRPWTPRR